MNGHWYDRLSQICEHSNDLNLFEVLYNRVYWVSQKYPNDSVAYMIYRFPFRIWNDQQNGDMVWVISREGQPVTVLLRRCTQWTWDFNTDWVVCGIF